MKFDNFV